MKIVHLKKLKLLSICGFLSLTMLLHPCVLKASQTEEDHADEIRSKTKLSNLKDPKINADNTDNQVNVSHRNSTIINYRDIYIHHRELNSSMTRKQPNFPVYR